MLYLRIFLGVVRSVKCPEDKVVRRYNMSIRAFFPYKPSHNGEGGPQLAAVGEVKSEDLIRQLRCQQSLERHTLLARRDLPREGKACGAAEQSVRGRLLLLLQRVGRFDVRKDVFADTCEVLGDICI